MYYKASELKKIFEESKIEEEKTLHDSRAEHVTSLLSEAIHEIQKIGIDVKLDLRGGGNPKAFSMGIQRCPLHGYLTCDGAKYLVALSTKEAGSDKDCLKLKISIFDLTIGTGLGKVDVSDDYGVFDLEKEDSIKHFQKRIIEKASRMHAMRKADVAGSLTGRKTTNLYSTREINIKH